MPKIDFKYPCGGDGHPPEKPEENGQTYLWDTPPSFLLA